MTNSHLLHVGRLELRLSFLRRGPGHAVIEAIWQQNAESDVRNREQLTFSQRLLLHPPLVQTMKLMVPYPEAQPFEIKECIDELMDALVSDFKSRVQSDVIAMMQQIIANAPFFSVDDRPMWRCVSCLVLNRDSNMQCTRCGSDRMVGTEVP